MVRLTLDLHALSRRWLAIIIITYDVVFYERVRSERVGGWGSDVTLCSERGCMAEHVAAAYKMACKSAYMQLLSSKMAGSESTTSTNSKAHLSGRSLPEEHKSSKRKCRLVVQTRGERWIGPEIDTTTTSNNGRLECRTNGVS